MDRAVCKLKEYCQGKLEEKELRVRIKDLEDVRADMNFLHSESLCKLDQLRQRVDNVCAQQAVDSRAITTLEHLVATEIKEF